MKKITISLDEETYQRARITAAKLDTSISSLVKRLLVELAGRDHDFKQLEELERTLRGRITSFRAGDRLSRDEAHERRP